MSARAFYSLLIVLTLVGAGLRLVHLNTTLAYDETVTVRFVEGGLPAILADYGGYGNSNNHVLNSLLAYASTRVFGLQVWALRLPSFLFGVLLIPLVGVLVDRLLRDRLTAAVATFLVAFSTILVAYSPACRGYAPLLFFALLSTWLILRVVDDGELGKLPLLVLTLFATGWSHMTGLVFAGTCGLLVVVLLGFSRRSDDPLAGQRRPAWYALIAISLAGLALLLWYSRGSFILQDVQNRLLHGKFVDPSLAGVGSVHEQEGLVPWIQHTGKKFFGTGAWPLLVCLPIALGGLVLTLRRNLRSGCILTCLVLFPPAVFLAGRLKPHPRYFLFVQPFVLVLVAVTLTWLGRDVLGRVKAGIFRRPVLTSFVLALAFQSLAFPLLRVILTGPGAKITGIAWDVKGAVDHIAGEIGPDDVVLSLPLPSERSRSNERHFSHSFVYHAETELAPVLSQPSTDELRIRRVWYVTPNPEIGDFDPLPLGFEPELVRELQGCLVFRDEIEPAGWHRMDVPLIEPRDGAPGAWTLNAPFDNVAFRVEDDGSGASDALRVALVVEENGADGELVSPPIPVEGGRLVELRTEITAEQSGGMRPFGRLGFHFYDEAGERVGSVSRTALLWDGLRPRPGESFLRLTTCVPRRARTMELFLGLTFCSHVGDVIRFRPPVLFGEG